MREGREEHPREGNSVCKGLEAGALHVFPHALGPLPLASAHVPDTQADGREHSGMRKRLPARGAATQTQTRSQTPSTRTSGHTGNYTLTHAHGPDAAGHPQLAPTVPSGGQSWHGGWTSADDSMEPWTLPGPPLLPLPVLPPPVPPQQPKSLSKQGWPSPDPQQRASPGVSQAQPLPAPALLPKPSFAKAAPSAGNALPCLFHLTHSYPSRPSSETGRGGSP